MLGHRVYLVTVVDGLRFGATPHRRHRQREEVSGGGDIPSRLSKPRTVATTARRTTRTTRATRVYRAAQRRRVYVLIHRRAIQRVGVGVGARGRVHTRVNRYRVIHSVLDITVLIVFYCLA